jgi:hypothetical protein
VEAIVGKTGASQLKSGGGQLPRVSGLPFIVRFRYRWSQGYLLAKMGKDQAFQMSGPWWEEYGRWESFSLVTVDIF